MDPTAALITRLLHRMVERDALAMYVEPFHSATGEDLPSGPVSTGVRILFLVHGVLELETEIRPLQRASLLSRVKKMAGMDQAGTAVPQQGRIRLQSPPLLLAVATQPTPLGEALTLRRVDPGTPGGG